MGSEWKPADLESFWSFYNTAQQWPSEMKNMLEQSTDYFYNNKYDEISTSQEHISALNDTASMIRLKSQEFVDEFVGTSFDEYTEDEEEENDLFDESFGVEGHIMGDEKDWTPEMAEFVRKTREHREQLAASRAKATTEQKTDGVDSWVDKDVDEFVFAEEIGVHGVQQLSTSAPTHNQDDAKRKAHRTELYGSAQEKISQLENQQNLQFEQVHKQTNAVLWPNIALRF